MRSRIYKRGETWRWGVKISPSKENGFCEYYEQFQAKYHILSAETLEAEAMEYEAGTSNDKRD